MASRAFSSRDVKSVDIESLVAGRDGESAWVGIDMGKFEFQMVCHWRDGTFERPWRAANPHDIAHAVRVLGELSIGRTLVIALEPSGTYGDALRQALSDARLSVHRVHPKVSHDYAEVFDGVPSQHDAKDAAVIAELARIGKSTPWPMRLAGEIDDATAQEIEYQVTHMDIHRRLLRQCAGRLEARLARHWPEVAQRMRRTSPTILRLLAEHASPAAIAADPHAAHKLRRTSRRRLGDEAIDTLLDSARRSVGVRMNEWDMRLMRQLAEHALDARRAVAAARKRLAHLTADHPVINAMTAVVGRSTACVLWAHLGDPRGYHAAGAYVKAMGLNLAERSSGAYQGRLKISKRGPAAVRHWLYLAAMRTLKQPPVKRYFNNKKQRDNQRGGKAMVAIMRRLAAAVYHVAVTQEPFDPHRLFPGPRPPRPRRPRRPRRRRPASTMPHHHRQPSTKGR